MKTPGPTLQLSPDNPWPGLRAFDEASSGFFFGRREETEALFRLVRRERLSVFYGRSGLGKTSLLHAGLFPLLRAANFLPVSIRLDYGVKAQPAITQVKEAIASALRSGGIDARPPNADESLWEYFHGEEVDFWDAQNRLFTLVLVFDQFEERFTMGRRDAATDKDAESFLAALSELIENRPPPDLRRKLETDPASIGKYDFDKNRCKVVLSLREDFLPELEGLRGPLPGILENGFRLQEMSEAAATEVVLKPASHLVTPQVAAEIVRFVAGGDAAAAHRSVEPVLLSVVLDELNQRRRKGGQAAITSDLLSGSREEILHGFYENALMGLPPEARRMIEEALLTSSGRRDSLAWEDIQPVFGVDERHILTLIDRHLLRREDRSDGARIELVHDRLAEVVRKQRERRQQEERQAALEHVQMAQRRKFRKIIAACGALTFLAFAVSGYLVWYYYQHTRLSESYYETFTKKWGVIEGVGPISKEQTERRACSFKVVRRGASGPVIHVEAIGSNGRPTPKNPVGTYLKYAEDETSKGHECQWDLIRDAEGNVAYEVAYDRNGTLVHGFVYSPATTDPHKRVGHFLAPNGLLESHWKSAADFVEIEYWPDGLEKRQTFLGPFGNPAEGRDGCYALYAEYNSQGLPVRFVWEDASGKPTLNRNGVAIATFQYDSRCHPVEWNSFDANGKPCLTTDGYAKSTARYDDLGNQVEWAVFDANGKRCLTKEGYAESTARYDEHGNQAEWDVFDTNGKPCLTNDGYAKWTATYDERGNQVEWACFDVSGKPCLTNDGYA